MTWLRRLRKVLGWGTPVALIAICVFVRVAYGPPCISLDDCSGVDTPRSAYMVYWYAAGVFVVWATAMLGWLFARLMFPPE
jgi:hypothetical protein